MHSLYDWKEDSRVLSFNTNSAVCDRFGQFYNIRIYSEDKRLLAH